MRRANRIAFVTMVAVTLAVGQIGTAADAVGLGDLAPIVFAVRGHGPDPHWYANFSYYAEDSSRKTYSEGGRLCLFDPSTGAVRTLLDDPQGGVRDPCVDYDGRTILFAYRKGGGEHYHLYEISADGTGLRQITRGDCDDFEPTYLPDDGIAFVSSRCNRWVNCWLTQVAILYRVNRDGSDVRQISANIEQDNTPWVLPDGRILYQRWEYVDRSQVNYHHLWTMNPDGTGQMVYFGNLHPGTLMIDAKPVPDTGQVIAIFSPGHGRQEHAGHVTIVDPRSGPDRQPAARRLHPEGDFRDPYPLDANRFLVARGTELLCMNAQGKLTTIYRLPAATARAGLQLHEPRPLRARPRERVIPPRSRPDESTGRLILADVYQGRNMRDVRPGEIKKLLVIESLPKPINYTGGMDPLSYGGTFTLERVVGTVPVEPDGSAYMELPALRSLFFVALDQNNLSVKRMQSFLSVQPGEVTGCVGCHEQRTSTFLPSGDLLALRRPPSRVAPISGVPDVFDFPRDIQPILDRLCVDCHGYAATPQGGPNAGGLILSGDHGPMFSHSYYMMTIRHLFADGRNRPESDYPPRTIGSSASRILRLIDGSHYGATATAVERQTMQLWIDTGAPYPGTYAALGGGMIGGYAQNQMVQTDVDWPEAPPAADVIVRRCSGCHTDQRILPRTLSDERGVSFWQPDMQDPRLKFSRHIVFNLSRPDQSLILLAPLAKRAGGFGTCRSADGIAGVFADTADVDYQKLRALVVAGQRRLAEIGRFDMPGFRPPAPYLREMARYGIIERIPGKDARIDPYALDRKYWRSLWYRPTARGRSLRERASFRGAREATVWRR